MPLTLGDVKSLNLKNKLAFPKPLEQQLFEKVTIDEKKQTVPDQMDLQAIRMKSSFIIQNNNISFDLYFQQMKKRNA